ncbi:uncharacterized protein LOC129768046 isoform X2 [Toxorhynchites rutilus septentrionalis]|uniref:uncharacterized protein LOC129768046 isoform X2 n=1 Tax=Toxorhynchites rutilus septentrionalis TaxID=329112 RepID=UPI00247AE9D9|nr:uncharacterized protein LOC129768046 isoform X2 [Toxorhynchites rutilus septentrionalis]
MNDDERNRMPLSSFNDKVDAHDLRREWEEWHRAFELIIQLRNIESQHDKLVIMLAMGGRGLQRIFYNLRPVAEEIIPEPVKTPLMPLEAPEYDNAVKRLRKFFIGKHNERVELELFRSLRQSSEESFNNFILRLRTQAARCEFLEREETELMQQITMGAHDEKVRDKGLENVMSLDEIITFAINREILLKQRDKQKLFRAETEVNSVRFGNFRGRNTSPQRHTGGNQRYARQSTGQWIRHGDTRFRSECNRCGSFRHSEDSRECFAQGAMYNNCGQRGHYARKCDKRARQHRIRQSKRDSSYRGMAEANSVGASESWEEEIPHRPTADDIAKVESHALHNGSVICQIDTVPVEFVIDSGSSINAVTEDVWNQLITKEAIIFRKRYQCDRKFYAYANHDPLNVIAIFESWISVNPTKPKTYAEFFVSRVHGNHFLANERRRNYEF